MSKIYVFGYTLASTGESDFDFAAFKVVASQMQIQKSREAAVTRLVEVEVPFVFDQTADIRSWLEPREDLWHPSLVGAESSPKVGFSLDEIAAAFKAADSIAANGGLRAIRNLARQLGEPLASEFVANCGTTWNFLNGV